MENANTAGRTNTRTESNNSSAEVRGWCVAFGPQCPPHETTHLRPEQHRRSTTNISVPACNEVSILPTQRIDCLTAAKVATQLELQDRTFKTWTVQHEYLREETNTKRWIYVSKTATLHKLGICVCFNQAEFVPKDLWSKLSFNSRNVHAASKTHMWLPVNTKTVAGMGGGAT